MLKRSVVVLKFEGFGREKVKKIIYIIVIIGSIGICFLGIRSNMDQEYQRKVDYAKSTIKNETVKVKRIDKQIQQLYQDDQEDFLMEPIDGEIVKNIERDIRSLKTEAVDFGLKETDFSNEFVEVIQGEQELSTKMADIEYKRAIQKKIGEHIVEAPVDWSVSSPDDIVIKETASNAVISQIHNEITKNESGWDKAMVACLNEMEAQVKQYTELKQSISAMSQDGVLTSSATMENFLLAISQLELIKNETLKQELSHQIDTIDSLLEKQALGVIATTGQEEVLPSE